jgi:predicted SAM-dependent methyltransferase
VANQSSIKGYSIMGLKYHLGCGLNYFPGYINIDYPQAEHSIVQIHADIYADLMTVKLELCEEIQSHHVYEHFNYMESLALLVKWTRALQVGGILIIDIPDMEILCRELAKSIQGQDLQRIFKITRLIFGSHEAAWAYHINGWTLGTMSLVLGKMGYSVIGAQRTGTPNALFPNCGIYMQFKKEQEVLGIDKIARDFLSYYCDLPAQGNLLEEFNQQYDILMGKI